eukprot:tig00020604_g11851.t1
MAAFLSPIVLASSSLAGAQISSVSARSFVERSASCSSVRRQQPAFALSDVPSVVRTASNQTRFDGVQSLRSDFFGAADVAADRFRRDARSERVGTSAVPIPAGPSAELISTTPEWKKLAQHAEYIKSTHLRELMKDDARNQAFTAEHNGIVLDYARQNMVPETRQLLFDLAKKSGLEEKIKAMAAGEHINNSEDRAVLHMALRAKRDEVFNVDGKNVVKDIHEVLDKIKDFSERVRTGKFLGGTGKPIQNIVAVGIGGSYLGPKFVYEALRTDAKGAKASHGRKLRFLANVDPVEVARCVEGLDPETTLVVVISKTFTTTETLLNAKTMRDWFNKAGITDVSKNMVAVSTNAEKVKEFGISTDNMFGFWDWVGGRYSVCSAVGVLPLALVFGYDVAEEFLMGARDIDRHFLSAPLDKNIPVLMGLIGVWNASFMGHSSRALLPYAQALLKLAPHVQQVAMESNGKRVCKDGTLLNYEAGEIEFGEPGTDGQHSFYQLIHQGRVVPCDFLGFAKSQYPVDLPGEHPVSNHDELMSNFFAQPDALAFGKTEEQVVAEGCPADLVPHKVFPGNRPSLSILFPESVTPFAVGQVLSLYEHRTAVEGFVWGLNSFDQWGVELGKILATQVRMQLSKTRKEGAPIDGFVAPTKRLMERYIQITKN